MFKSKSSRAAKQLQLQQQQQQLVAKQDYFQNCHRTYSCIHCRAHLANHDELISKLFQGNHGRAYLFNKVTNIGCKQAVERELLTGLHAVADIYCDSCETTLGWKYEQAFVPSQKYKEGKYIIELVHMLKENDWDLTSYNARDLLEEGDESGPRTTKARLSVSLNDNFGVGVSNNPGMSPDQNKKRRRRSDGETKFNRRKQQQQQAPNQVVSKNSSDQLVLESKISATTSSSTSSSAALAGAARLSTKQSNHEASDSMNGSSVETIRDDVVMLSEQRSNDTTCKQMPLPNQFTFSNTYQTATTTTTTTTTTATDGLELIERSLGRLQVEPQTKNHDLDATTASINQSLSGSPKSSSSCSSSTSPSDMSSSSSGAPVAETDGPTNET